MKNALLKNIYREIVKTMSRFLSIVIIVALGVAFFAGVKATSGDMRFTVDNYLDRQNVADINIFSTEGFSDIDIRDIAKMPEVQQVIGGYNIDCLLKLGKEDMAVKVHSLPNTYMKDEINKPIIIEGRLPRKQNECLIESKLLRLAGLKIGDKIELQSANIIMKYDIVGIGRSPLYLEQHNRGSNSMGNGETQGYVQIMESAATTLAMPIIDLPYGVELGQVYTEILITLKDVKDINCFDDEYKDRVEAVVTTIEDMAENKKVGEWFVLDRNKNFSFVGYSNDILRIKAIGSIFPILFFLVAALISLTTMTRMVEEQRTQIGTLKALGYYKWQILMQYFLYALLASLIGSVIGLLVGFNVFPRLIFEAYRILYDVPNIEMYFQKDLTIISVLTAVICTTSAAIFACINELIAVPSVLMRPKSPKLGKRIFLERISFIWKRLVFTSKVTARNLLRYKKRFFMSVIGIGACTALLLTGYGLKDSIVQMSSRQYNTVFTYDVSGTFKKNMSYGESKYFAKDLQKYNEIKKATVVYEHGITVIKDNSDYNSLDSIIIVPQNNEQLNEYIKLTYKEKPVIISDSGVIITEKLSKLQNIKIGETIKIERGDDIVYALVDGISENYLFHYIYMSNSYYENLFKEKIRYNKFYANYNIQDVDETQLGKELMKDISVSGVGFAKSANSNMGDMLGSIDYVVVVMIISAALLAFIVMYNLTNININERIRELATIKVLGFYDNEVAMYIYRENIVLSVLGAAIGIFMGIFIHRIVLDSAEVDMIMFVREIKTISYVYSFVLTLIFAGIVNIVMYRKIKEINMVEALKIME